MLKKSAQLSGMRFVIPGTRFEGAELGQQKRSDTPEQAIADGGDVLVASSMVTKASDPVVEFNKLENAITASAR